MHVIELKFCLAVRVKVRYLPRPGLMKLTGPTEKDGMLVYQAQLPALPNPIGDVVKQHLTVTAPNGVDILSEDYGLEVTVSGEFKCEDGAEFVLSLTYVDDAGNVSAPSKQSFTAVDTIPPDAPGAFGEIKLIREEP
jgi:hypothetical protein